MLALSHRYSPFLNGFCAFRFHRRYCCTRPSFRREFDTASRFLAAAERSETFEGRSEWLGEVNTYFAVEPLLPFIGCQFRKQFRSEFTCFRVEGRVVHGLVIEKMLETGHAIGVIREVVLQGSGSMVFYSEGEQAFFPYRNSSP